MPKLACAESQWDEPVLFWVTNEMRPDGTIQLGWAGTYRGKRYSGLYEPITPTLEAVADLLKRAETDAARTLKEIC